MAHPDHTGSFWDSKTDVMADKSDCIRTFVAIPLPDHVKRFLSNVQSELRSARLPAAWPDPDRFHLTLKFLGPTPRDMLLPIQSAMADLSGAFPELTLKAEGMGVFPNVKKARVVWSGIRGQTRQLTQVVTALDRQLHAIGIPAQSRPFFPHITLARIKKPVRQGVMNPLIKRFENEISPAFRAKGLVFYESRLSPEGAVHTPLFQIKLNS
jgi:2'-5' RNA ligase